MVDEDDGRAEYRFVQWPAASTEQLQMAEKAANDLAADGWEMEYTTLITAGPRLLTTWKRYRYAESNRDRVSQGAPVPAQQPEERPDGGA